MKRAGLSGDALKLVKTDYFAPGYEAALFGLSVNDSLYSYRKSQYEIKHNLTQNNDLIS